MLEAAKKFAQRVILIHLGLLLIVIALLSFGAHQLYVNALAQQINSTKDKQQLLARQTARGIEAYYRSITDDMELILSPDAADATRPAETITPDGMSPGGPGGPPGPGNPGFTSGAPGEPPFRPGGQGFGPGGPGPGGPGANPAAPGNPLGRGNNPGGRGGGPPGLGGLGNRPGAVGRGGRVLELRTVPASDATLQIIALQLRTRVSALFIVEEKETVEPRTGAKSARISFSYPPTLKDNIQKVADRNLQWITSLTDTAVSDFITLDNGQRIHLIGVRARRMEQQRPTPCFVIAAVPISSIEDKLFDPLNNQGLTNAALVDSQGTIMIAIDPQLVGLSVTSPDDNSALQAIRPFVTKGESGSVVIPVSTTFHGVTFPPRITTFEQVNKDFENTSKADTRPAAGTDNRWIVMISSPLANTEALVNDVFKSALFWAIFVAISVTGLFFSSSFFLIRSRIKYERQRSDLLTRELSQARDIQLAWLPKSDTSPAGLDIAAINLPASHISGDFYNWFLLPDGRIAVVIGDVTGHGMSAAFLMSTSQLLIRTTLLRINDPGQCMEEVNRQLCTQNFAGQFVTMLLMVLDPLQSTIEIAAAGHPAPLVANRSAFRPLEIETQLVLGVDPTTRYPTQSYVLHPGSTLLLYTDGVVEAESANGTMFQTTRLLASVSKDFPTAQAIVNQVVADVRSFSATTELLDDLTLVALQLLPVPQSVNQPQSIATKL